MFGCAPWIAAYFWFTGALVKFILKMNNRFNGLRSYFVEVKCTLSPPPSAIADGVTPVDQEEDTAAADETKEDDDDVVVQIDDKDRSGLGVTFRWHYLDSDPNSTLPIVVLIHGFGAFAGSWAELGGKLRKSFRVIAPDLTGHGQTLPVDLDMDYGIQQQTVRLKSLFDEILGSETKFHVLGTSMGGWISSNFATLYPDNVLSLSLLCPAGAQPALTDERKAHLEEARKSLLWHDVPGFRAMFPMIMVKKFSMPTRIAKSYVATNKGYEPIGRKLLAQLQTEYSAEINKDKVMKFVHGHLPVLLIWGDADKILPIESMELFQENLTNIKCEVIPRCGHAMMMDKGKHVCQSVFDFISVVQADPEFFAEERDDKSGKPLKKDRTDGGSTHDIEAQDSRTDVDVDDTHRSDKSVASSSQSTTGEDSTQVKRESQIDTPLLTSATDEATEESVAALDI